MLISLNWIRDFVDLPADLDPRALAEKFTRTTAEVEGVHPIEVEASGLIAARVESAVPISGANNLRLVTLNVGSGRVVETVSAAPVIHVGKYVVYAPVGSKVSSFGTVNAATVAGRASAGMILPGEAIGIEMVAQEAIWLGDEFETGQELPASLFEDWVIEIDNKSITHRPDLWGHYGIAREIAAILRLPLKPYSLESLDRFNLDRLPEVPITIADPQGCRRYSGIVLADVPARPAPLWIQLRLGHIGLRPITALVDLTNYIMCDIGQPMHAFDADRTDRIEVARAKADEKFRTLDGVERTLTTNDLMIQCRGQSIGLAGVMGGENTEVSPTTTRLLLESASFDPATIRRTASRLGLRTDASARFEKSLDPNHTVMSIQRFLGLAKQLWPNLKPLSRLSDCYARPLNPITVTINERHVARAIGRELTSEEIVHILTPLGFNIASPSRGGASAQNGASFQVDVPSYRGTNDVSIEVDIIEELARYIGYDTIIPAMPRVSVRRVPLNALHELEQRTLEYFTNVEAFYEIHGYIWYEAPWLATLKHDPGACVELRNPAGEGLHQLRKSLVPGLLAGVTKNRFGFPTFSLIELGSVFEPHARGDQEHRHVGLIIVKRAKKADEELTNQLKQAISGWGRQRFNRTVEFLPASVNDSPPWVDASRTAGISIDNTLIGHAGVIPLALRLAMDEHLSSWSIAWAEMRLNDLVERTPRAIKLGTIPPHPLVDLDVTLMISKGTRYADVVQRLSQFKHPLLKSIRYMGHYEGQSIGADHRTLTFRAVIGDDNRTLNEQDTVGFRREFDEYLRRSGYDIR